MLEDRIKMYITSYSEEVTGSNNHVKIEWPDGRDVSFVVDCGLFQESKHNHINSEPLRYKAENIYFAIATHVHTDHVGRFPYLINSGFAGLIYSSYETSMILPTVLSESYDRLEDEYRCNLKKYREQKLKARKSKLNARGRGRKDFPRREKRKCRNEGENLRLPTLIYDRKDIENTMKRICVKKMNETFSPYPGIEVTFYPNAHISGAVITVCRVFDENEENFLLFTGDLGLTNPLTNVKTLVPDDVLRKIDVVISESTYGSADISKNTVKERAIHKEIVKNTFNKNGTIMYLSNSLERPLILGVDIKKMQEEVDTEEQLEKFNIYFDSTFGIQCLRKYVKLYGKDYLPHNFNVVNKDSREDVILKKGPKMIICTSPRLFQGSFLNYGKRMLEDPNVTLIFVAYVPEEIRNIISLPYGTEIDFLGEKVKLRCRRYQFGYYSSHVCTEEMDKFMSLLKGSTVLLFNHGNQDSKINFAKRYKTSNNTTHNLLYGKTVMITRNGIEKYF